VEEVAREILKANPNIACVFFNNDHVMLVNSGK
jgi:ABC-type sugar transport system substrate-binding protein